MPTKVNWGEKLERKEVEDREGRWQDNCFMLKEAILDCLHGQLKGYELDIEFEYVHPICIDCPEKPNECHLCKFDASMSRFFERPGLIVKFLTSTK